jgi:large subunit ribosomal protein L25
MKPFELTALRRDDVGKGASRRLRRAGLLPGIVYGAGGEAEPVAFQSNELEHKLQNEAFYSHILTLRIDGREVKVVLRDLQRHPVRSTVTHVDLQRIDETQELTMRVPIHFVNEDRCHGVKQEGGVLTHIMTDLEISCLPKDLPEYIEIDVADLGLNQTLHLSDIKTPPGVSIYALKHGGDPSQPVVTVQMPKVIEEVEVAAEAEAAAAEAVAPAAGEAPAAPPATAEDK